MTSYAEVHHLEEESIIIPLAMTNLLHDNIHKREDDMEENEELTTSYANSEPSLHNAPVTPAENTGYDRLEGSHNNTNIFSCSLKKQVHFQEGEHCWWLPMSARPSIPALSLD